MASDDFSEWSRRLESISAGAFIAPVFVSRLGEMYFPSDRVLFRVTSDRVNPESFVRMGSVRVWPALERGYIATVERGTDALLLAQELQRTDGIEFAEPDWIFTGRGAGAPSDPDFSESWALSNSGQFGGLVGLDLGALAAWSITRGGPTVSIGLIDTGVEFSHPDLPAADGFDATNGALSGEAQGPCDGHGTNVAGCLSAIVDNGIGSAGLSPECRLRSIRVFVGLPACDGSWTSQVSWTVEALDWAQAAGISVTNNSNTYGVVSASIAAKYADTRSAGMIHFASAGNLSMDFVTFPASAAAVHGVSGIQPTGAFATTSSWGGSIEFSGPSEFVFTTDLVGDAGSSPESFTLTDGTSYSSAFVAASAALIRSLRPDLDPDAVFDALRDSALDLGPVGWDERFGWGMPHAGAALASVTLPFRRGDVDDDGRVTIADAVSILEALFLSVPAPCLDVLDIDADQSVDLTDVVGLLGFLFAAGSPPAAPYPDCGLAPLGLPCSSFPSCSP